MHNRISEFMRVLACAIIFILLNIQVHSQVIKLKFKDIKDQLTYHHGISAGLLVSKMLGYNINVIGFGTTKPFQFGGITGYNLDISYKNVISLTTGLNFNYNKNKITWHHKPDGSMDNNLKLQWNELDIPFSLDYYPFRKEKLCVGIGAGFNFRIILNGKATFNTFKLNDSYEIKFTQNFWLLNKSVYDISNHYPNAVLNASLNFKFQNFSFRIVHELLQDYVSYNWPLYDRYGLYLNMERTYWYYNRNSIVVQIYFIK